jgi:perosamine synthetase
MKRIHEVAEDTRLPVIEDAAHAAGATYRDGKVGSFGRAGCFSFYPTKPLTTGEGGMITTEEDEVARKARSLRSLSTERTQGLNYDVRSLGFTYRMSELQAALGLHQLDALDHTNSLMRTKASVFKRRLKGVRGLILPYEAPYVKHVYNLFVVRVMPREFGKDRDEVSSALLRKGIATQLHYIPIHRLTFFSRIAKFKKATLKVSESLGKTVLSLPLYPRIRADELDRVVSALLSCRNGS